MIHRHIWSALYLSFLKWIIVDCQSLEDAKILHTDLLKDYNKFVRPIKDQTKSVDVRFFFSLVAIQDFDEVRERFSVTGVFFLHWKDESMAWNKEDYGNITTIFMGYKDVWVPEIILTNPSQKLDSYGKEWQLIRYDSKGNAAWYPGDLIKATCSLDVRYFPFDIQECSMELYVWGYSVFEVTLKPLTDQVDTSLLRGEHGTWKLLNTSAKSEVINYVSKATFTFRLERKSQYVIVNIVLPILFLCILNVMVFVLPAESGERVSYAITVLLAIAVFMTIISDTLPKKSEPLPLISYFLMIDLIVSALISVFTIANLLLYHKNDNKPIPNWLLKLYGFLVCSCRHGKEIVVFKKNSKEKTACVKIQNNRVYDVDTNAEVVFYQTPVKRFDSRTPASDNENIGWKDISKMFDYILLVFFSFMTFLSFILFLTITQVQ